MNEQITFGITKYNEVVVNFMQNIKNKERVKNEPNQ